MKNYLFALIFLTISSALFAQDDINLLDLVKSQPADSVRVIETPASESVASQPLPIEYDWRNRRHTFELTAGDPLPLQIFTGAYTCGCGPEGEGYPLDYLQTCHHADIVLPTINLSYHYAVLSWFEVGVTAGTSANLHRYYYNGKETLFGHRQAYIMVDARFTYLRRDIITLYSGIGLGLEIDHHDQDHKPLGTRKTTYLPAGQLTAIGMQLGRKVYWSLEAGFGTKGIVNTGIGFRF